MLSTVIILTFSLGITKAQINGEFWWLNDKLAEYKGIKPAPVKFEEVSVFETDETDKVVFNNNNEDDKINNKWNFHFQDRTQLAWPNVRATKSSNVQNTTSKQDRNSGDVLEFKFPDDNDLIWKNINNTSEKPVQNTINSSDDNENKNKTVFVTDKVTFKVYKEETTQVQNICTYLKKGECKRRNGVVYAKRDRPITIKAQTNSLLVCCILPLPVEKPTKIYFADDFPVKKRLKRSTNKGDGLSSALKQRNALMLRRFPTQNRKIKAPSSTAATKLTNKIVTLDDDYIDPYANIKNDNFKKQNVPENPYQVTSTKYEYGNEDYVEDYVVELPRPGLIGLYSDHGPSSSWTYVNEKHDSPYNTMDTVDDDSDIPGYSTFDPRLVDRLAIGASRPSRPKPIKFATDDSGELLNDGQSYTVNYRSRPDFHVFRGFKLLNLYRNTSRTYSKTGRKTTTTERVRDRSECIKTRPVFLESGAESDNDDFYDVSDEIFHDCGKAVKDPLKDCEHDKQTGEADIGSHPWLALVVLTKNPQSILCYASLVHPRAAVTAADCVYGRTSPGQVTLLAGVWDLEDSSSVRTQQRMASVHIEPQYKPGNLAHNYAMLHWKRPLQLGVNVQPACVADPHVGDECKFVGWGGYDQAIKARPRWQRASILTPRQCNERLSSSHRRVTLPSDTFCASVDSRASVTGVGGPLTCSAGSRHSVVGVAVWRDNALVLLPAHEWTVRTVAALRIR